MNYTKEAERIKLIKPDFDGFYKKIGDTVLPIKIYNPKGSKKTAVIAIHGGGWHSVEKGFAGKWDGGWMNFQAQYYADKGYTACAFSYRTIDFDETTTVFDLIEDCKDGVKFLKENADFDKLIIMGDSAGGHLAVELAFDDEIGADICIPANPVLDLTDEKWRYTAKNTEQLVKSSPALNIKKTNVNFLVMHGNADKVVDINVTKKFCRDMQEKCPVCKFVELENAEHAFILLGYKSGAEQVFEYMKIIDEFINNN